jgi:hypothetical protein
MHWSKWKQYEFTKLCQLQRKYQIKKNIHEQSFFTFIFAYTMCVWDLGQDLLVYDVWFLTDQKITLCRQK